jgi:hypothetical protein
MSVDHRIRLPGGAEARVMRGQQVEPDQALASHRPPGTPIGVPVAVPLRQSPEAAGALLLVLPGATVSRDEVLARAGRGREVRSPADGLVLGFDRSDGSVMLAPFGEPQPVIGHVRGEVTAVEDETIDLRVPGAMLLGVGGTGDAVHGELQLAVHEPGDELRAGAIDVGATGRILVGGSRASAETLTRARAMGVAGIVLGGVLDKELRDFEAIQHRRREIGGLTGAFAILLLEGFGKVGFDPQLFAWFRRQRGRMASLFGAEARLFVYDADPPPARGPLPGVGDRVVAHRRPYAGRGGRLERVLDGLHAAASGIPVVTGVVRFEDGLIATVPLANLEAAGPAEGEEEPGDDRGG